MSISFSKLFSSAAAAPLFLETSVVAIETHHQIVRLFTEEVGYSILCGVDCYSRSEESVSDKCGVCFVCVCVCVFVCVCVCVCVCVERIKTDPCSPNQKALCQIRIQLLDGQRLQDA